MNRATNLYVEPSAILAWLLGEAAGDDVRQWMQSAELVLTSDLTLIECDRVLQRGQLRGVLSLARVAQTRTMLDAVADHWTVFTIDHEVIERARRPFPRGPVRTADAIHLATALAARNLVTELTMASLDPGVRGNAVALGLDLLPLPGEDEVGG